MPRATAPSMVRAVCVTRQLRLVLTICAEKRFWARVTYMVIGRY